jgi:hypothetical protein
MNPNLPSDFLHGNPPFRGRPARPCAGCGASVEVPALAERSAARLAHQSGGLGVPSSNLGAPTNKIKHFCSLSLPSKPSWEAYGKMIRYSAGCSRSQPDLYRTGTLR